jgi:hypothetical protein
VIGPNGAFEVKVLVTPITLSTPSGEEVSRFFNSASLGNVERHPNKNIKIVEIVMIR